jgi:hypothetical protein
MRRTRSQNQRRSSKVARAQNQLQEEINRCLTYGFVIRDLSGNPVSKVSKEVFDRFQFEANRNPSGLWATFERDPKLAEALLATQQPRLRTGVEFLNGGADDEK